MNKKPLNLKRASAQPLNRPGVTDAYLKSADVRRVTGTEARNLCGLPAPGTWIPYRTISGKPVVRECDAGKPFGRLRLDQPGQDGQKYHQAAGTKPYGYLGDLKLLGGGLPDLVIVEGEFKSLALCEAGIPAVGIGGINIAFDGGDFVPGLRELLQNTSPKRVLFLGDGDTSLIFAFSREAIKIARKLPGVQVLLPRIGLDGPGKGIDDVREVLGDKFDGCWAKLVADAEPVGAKDRPEDLALRLFERESDAALNVALT